VTHSGTKLFVVGVEIDRGNGLCVRIARPYASEMPLEIVGLIGVALELQLKLLRPTHNKFRLVNLRVGYTRREHFSAAALEISGRC